MCLPVGSNATALGTPSDASDSSVDVPSASFQSLRPCLTSACSSDSTDEPTEVGDEHHRLGHLRQLLPVADETPAAGGQDAEGLLDAPAERDRDEALALPRARGDGEDRAVPGGVAGDVLA